MELVDAVVVRGRCQCSVCILVHQGHGRARNYRVLRVGHRSAQGGAKLSLGRASQPNRTNEEQKSLNHGNGTLHGVTSSQIRSEKLGNSLFSPWKSDPNQT